MLRAIVPTVVALVAWIASAEAQACKIGGVSVFKQADEATTVALGRIVSVVPPSPHAFGRVRLEVTEAFEGVAIGDRVTALFGNSSCDPKVRKTKKTVLVFTNADGQLVARYNGFVVAPTAEMIDAVRRWSATSDPADRLEILLAALAGTDLRLAWHAVNAADNEAIAASLDDEQRARLTTAVQTFKDAQTP